MIMRQALPSSGKIKARPLRIPAPIGGWNTSDSLAQMRPTDAVYLDNFFPQTSDVILRKGHQLFASIPTGKTVRTVIGYKATSGAAQIFAAAEDGLYDITLGGAVIASSTAATEAAWEYTPVTTAGGSFILLCNATDKMKLYDGAAWTDLDDLSVPAITGVVTSDVANINKFKTRVILCVKNSLSFWYLPNNAIAGAAVEYPLGALFNKGGYLMATSTWTVDGGNGPDDYFVAITSEGEVAVFSGTDPSSASTFALVGIFQLAKPMSRRCFTKMASDTAVITREAVYPLMKSLGLKDRNSSIALSNKIQRAYSEFADTYADLFGWSVTLHPEASMLLVNVPLLNQPARSITYSYQFVMNLMTGAWCRFTNMSAECFTSFDGELYSALHNKVMLNWTGQDDLGANIVGSAKTAFSPLASSGNKRVTMVKPLISSGGSLTIQLGLDVDYADGQFTGGVASYVQTSSLWNTAVWNVAKWSGSGLILSVWRAVACRIGKMVAVRLRCSSKDVSMTWIETGLIVEDAGLL